jgi:hypothetical protein
VATYNDGKLKTTSVQKKYRNVNTRFYAFPMDPVIKTTKVEPRKPPMYLNDWQIENLKREGALLKND